MARPNLLDPKTRAAKKRKQAIILGVVFLVVLGISVPKTMKMMNQSAPATSSSSESTSETSSTASGATSVTASTTGTAQVVAATSGDAQVVNADLAPAPLEGQLADFTVFDAKDPFVPQKVDTSTVYKSDEPAGSNPTTANETKPSARGVVVTDEPTSPTVPSLPPTEPSTTPTTTPTTSTPTTTVQPTSATISVNGVQEVVNVASDFPGTAPLFRLVKLTTKSAEISIAGGSLATGAPTVTLKLGKTLTLMNTADGTRYVLILVSTGVTPAAGTPTPTP